MFDQAARQRNVDQLKRDEELQCQAGEQSSKMDEPISIQEELPIWKTKQVFKLFTA